MDSDVPEVTAKQIRGMVLCLLVSWLLPATAAGRSRSSWGLEG